MMKTQLRELMISVDNPGYDKRRKFGEDSIATYKSGQRFLLSFYGENNGVLAGLPSHAKFVGGKQERVDGGTLVKLLYASSKEVEPQTFQDLRAINGISAEETIDQLLSDKEVTIDQISHVHTIIQARYEKEEEERQKEREAKKLAKQAEMTTTTTTPPPTEETPVTSSIG